MENKGCYELVVRDSKGKELLNQIFPLDSIIGVVEQTYPKELDGWCHVELLFSNLKKEKQDK